jgi:hypothetical protein
MPSWNSSVCVVRPPNWIEVNVMPRQQAKAQEESRMITAGIDMGSRSIKVVLVEELKVDGAPQLKYGVKKSHIMMPGDLDQDVAADKAYNEALAAAGIKKEDVKAGVRHRRRAQAGGLRHRGHHRNDCRGQGRELHVPGLPHRG